ncbi:hypothetical protein [Nakamurella lactea]|uniref:hypothetical protein n=1 Tax=Nakamurella lactea TaxID=459515 RepID=UPI000562BC22|nr:hypothetical protein [Nakamurella lactea]
MGGGDVGARGQCGDRVRMRPKGWMARRLTGFLGVLAAVLSTVTGCSGVPDRTDLAAAITAELRQLPGVDDVVGDYQNGMTSGQSYNVRVRFTPAVAADEVNTLVALYFSRLADPKLDGHTSSLNARIDDSSMTFFSGRTRPDPPLTIFQRWYTLTGALDGPFGWSMASEGDLNLIEYSPAGGVDAAVEQLRTVAPDLQHGVHWKIRRDRTTVAMQDGFLTGPVAALAEAFAATHRQWNIEADPAIAPGLAMAVWKGEAEALEPTARTDLLAIAALGTPVRYTLKVGGGPHLQVFVGGCEPDGTGLQQQLNTEFGSC